MSRKTDFISQPTGTAALLRRVTRGISIIELLIVIVILGSLGAIAAVAYQTYITSVKIDLSTNQMLTIEDRIKTDFDLTLRGVNTGLISPVTNQPITSKSKCEEFLAAMRPRLRAYKNPFDGSPTVTYSDANRQYQKQGKVRVTCYKMHLHMTFNGGGCPLTEAAIRITRFRTHCGGACGKSICTIKNADCRGHDPTVWYEGMEKDTIIGKLLKKYITLRGKYKYPDVSYGQAACGPYFRGRTVPKEPDY